MKLSHQYFRILTAAVAYKVQIIEFYSLIKPITQEVAYRLLFFTAM